MQVFPVRTRASIDIAIADFGTQSDKEVWREWSVEHPEIRQIAADPMDDGAGPMVEEVRQLIISCLRRRYDHLRQQSRSPWTTPNDMVGLSNIMSHVYSVARSLSPAKLEWPSIF